MRRSIRKGLSPFGLVAKQLQLRPGGAAATRASDQEESKKSVLPSGLLAKQLQSCPGFIATSRGGEE
jgi:hypothetical protein